MMEPGHMDAKIEAYIAVSPRGHCIMSTIRSSADDVWCALRGSLFDSNRLQEVGWRVHRLEYAVMEVAE